MKWTDNVNGTEDNECSKGNKVINPVITATVVRDKLCRKNKSNARYVWKKGFAVDIVIGKQKRRLVSPRCLPKREQTLVF